MIQQRIFASSLLKVDLPDMMCGGMQVITGAHDKTIRLWDIRKPSTMATLTYHKKSVRALAMHPTECGPHRARALI